MAADGAVYPVADPIRVPDAEGLATLREVPTDVGGNELSVRCLETWAEVASLEQDWCDLVGRASHCHVYQTYGWHAAWWRAFSAGRELKVVACFRGSRLIGLAPMVIETRIGRLGRPKRWLCFLGAPNNASDYADLIIDDGAPEALDSLVQELLLLASRYDGLRLSSFPTGSPNCAAVLRRLNELGAKVIDQRHQRALTRVLGDRDEDLRAARKKSLNRHHNKLRKSGELVFRQCADDQEIHGYLDEFFRQHVGRWSRNGEDSQFESDEQKAFYRALVDEISGQGWLRFDVLLLDGRPLAFHFGFEYRNRFFWYKPTFDTAWAGYSPGEVMLKFLLQDAIDRELSEFDFTVGDEPYKYRFCNEIRENRQIVAYSSALDYWVSRGSLICKRLKTHIRTRFGRGSG